jgi:hypothetical protein
MFLYKLAIRIIEVKCSINRLNLGWGKLLY